MPVIENAIGPRAFEFLGERICEILKDELESQSGTTLLDDPYLNADVYRERFIKVDSSELREKAVVNVQLSRVPFDFQTDTTKIGTYQYEIDVYCRAEFDENERGDTKAFIRLQRVLAVVYGILNHQKYRTLGYGPGTIAMRSVQSIQIGQIPKELSTWDNTVMGRVTLEVRADDEDETDIGTLIEEYNTQVHPDENDNGYFYSNVNDTFPPNN